MEELYAACIAFDPGLLDYVDFKRVTEPIWLLGKKYNIRNDDHFESLNNDIKSKLWFTYRKQFLPIGNTNLTSDSGWGCMHRCGQMLLAQAFILKYFGRDWKWSPDSTEATYKRILEKFNDKIECQYSIHKIAITGSVIEKQVGQWFGPNTVAQVLKRLLEEDSDNDLLLHVAMDNMVIKCEIRKLFNSDKESVANSLSPDAPSSSCVKVEPEIKCNASNRQYLPKRNCPVLLSIPLRLGLSEIMPVYFEKLKASFTLKQSLGMIGGRTNHASYYIGYVGDELIYLDPHTTQLYKNGGPMDDVTYHCNHPSRMSFTQLDPSIALCFYLNDEEDFEDWCKQAQKLLLEPEKDAIFEIMEEKPPMLQYVDIDEDDLNLSLTEQDRIYTSDDEFELIM